MASRGSGRRFGLRSRIILAFALGAFALSVILAFVTYGLTRENLLNRSEEASVSRAIFNAQQANSQILGTTETEQLQDLISNISTPAGSLPLIQLGSDWVAANALEFGEAALDPGLRAAVSLGNPAVMRYNVDGQSFQVVGIPLPEAGVDVAYYEANSLDDINDTLDSLLLALVGAAGLTTLAGVVLGIWASYRALLPLSDISDAAESIAAGDLSTRLSAEEDRDLEKITNSFNHMASALEERLDRDARFASEVSHELRSPLMTFTASIEILQKRRDELPPTSQTALDLLASDVERFQHLVDDLLEISRFDVGIAALSIDEFELTEFVRQAVSQSGRQPDIEAAPGAAGTLISADKRRLAQVMANLIDNAYKYGGGEVTVAVESSGDSFRLTVADQGPGVPFEERELIFDRFSRGSEGGRRGAGTGTGLGLSLVSEHVKLHGGQVWIDDPPDGSAGARFVVEIPGVIQ
jgi:two-component system sensor histidine kinase MtrB